LTLSISPLLRSPHHLLITSILSSFLPFFLPHLPTTAPATHLRLALHQLLPSLLEKLNDPKERVHSSASSCIAILGQKCYEAELPTSSSALHAGANSNANGNGNGNGIGNGNGNGALGLGISVKGKEKEGLVGYWERSTKETMTAKGWRGKVEAMKMLLTMRSKMGAKLPLKPWIAPLVDLLEDGDNHVRDQAREVSCELRVAICELRVARCEPLVTPARPSLVGLPF
jgi:CLIP-associating protein 1/2